MDKTSLASSSPADPDDRSDTIIKIIIAEDHPFFRDGIVNVLNNTPDIRVIGTVSDGLACVKMARELKPDIILMDVQMPKLGGLAATRQIYQENPHVNIIMLSMFEDAETVGEAFSCSASYLLKDTEREDLIAAIHIVRKGFLVLGSKPVERIREAMMGGRIDRMQSEFSDLSKREIEVLKLLANDESNKDIASHLHISEKTVRNHVSNIISKLSVKDRHAAARRARNALQETAST
jgi:DNA-binding NarL/FixJ family response regulator